MAKIIAVNISEKKGTFKHPVEGKVRFVPDHGIVGDAHAGNWHRQVSLLAQESIDKMTALGVNGLTPGKFAENITTEGIELHTLPVGTKLRMGTAIAEVTQIGKECHQHCQIYKQVGKCIMPTEGIFVKILEEGEAGAGDELTILSRPATVWIIVASDKGAKGEREDLSGPAIREEMEGIAQTVGMSILPDDRDSLADLMREIADNRKADLILTSGGTGLAPRDVTPEATKDIIEREVPGIPEAMRANSMQYTDKAMLSRAAAGIRNRTLIINLPGSPKAVRECIAAIRGALPHAIETLRGEAYECARKD